jgi:ankyrin repeat protein
MRGLIGKIFGQQAASQPVPAAPPAKPATKPPQKKGIWRLIEDNNAVTLGEAIAENPALLQQTKTISYGKAGSITVTPLMYAAYTGKHISLAALHKAGGDIDRKGDQGLTPLHLAARCKYGEKAVEYILSHSTLHIDTQAQSGATPLIEAARQGGSNGNIKALLRHGAKPDGGGGENVMPAIVAAAAAGNAGGVEALLDGGAYIDAKNKVGRTALWYAAFNYQVQLADMLVSRGASLHIADEHGVTPLMGAARLGNPALVKLLIESGLDVNQTDTNGCSALHYTCLAEGGPRCKEVAELLVAAGAYIDMTDRQGEQPIDRARRLKSTWQQPMTDFFQQKLDDPSSPRDPTYLAVFSEGTEQRVTTMKALKFKTPSP